MQPEKIGDDVASDEAGEPGSGVAKRREARSELEESTRGTGAKNEQELFALLYDDLKRRAHGQLRNLPPGATLQPTVLVHEAYARLRQKGHGGWKNRSQFFAIAVRAMRDVLVETIRRKSAIKRGGDAVRVTLNDERDGVTMGTEGLASLNGALGKLEEENPVAAQMVLLRFLAGFTMEEIAEMQQVTVRTVERRWRFARAWLQAEMKAS